MTLRAVATPSYNQIRNAPSENAYRIAVIGTSLVQHNARAISTPLIGYWTRGWWTWCVNYSKNSISSPIWYDPAVVVGWEPSGVGGTTRYFQGLDFGVSGQTGAQIIARLPYITKYYKDSFDMIIVDCGTNDMGTLSIAENHANRVAVCEWALELGKKVVLLPILARGTGSWASGGTERKRANALNSLSRTYVASKKNLYFFDWNEAWVDKTTADGTPKTGYSPDEIHFSQNGGDAVGYALWQFLSRIVPQGQPRVWSKDDVYDSTENVYGNLLSNAFMSGTAGTNGTGSSGTVADGMRVERNSGTACTVVNSKETRSDGRGSWQVMTFAISGTTEETFYLRTSTADTTHELANKWGVASCEVECNASDAITSIDLELIDQNGTGGLTAQGNSPYDSGSGNVKYSAITRSFLITTPPILFASDSTTARWRVSIKVKGAATVSPIIKVGGIEFRQVSAPSQYPSPVS